MNVILIETDQLSAKWLGCYGNPAAHTPNLDKLARHSTKFINCFANNPVCMPSRASTMTGRSCQHHGVLYNGWELTPDHPTFPQVLQQNGVQTFGVGKFHLECHANGAHLDVLKYGFDRAETTEDIRAGDWLDWVGENHPESYDNALATCWPMEGLHKYGPDQIDLVEDIMEARSKFVPEKPLDALRHPSKVPEEVCQTTWITSRALDFMSERDKDKPFYLKVSYVDPHDLYDPPARFLDLIDKDLIPDPVSGAEAMGLLGEIPFVKNKQLTNDQWKEVRHHYFASIAFVDEQIGRIMDYLEKTGLSDNTAIIFTADHGDMMGDHGFPTKGSWHYDACIRVPFLLHLPGQTTGNTESRAISNLDIFPTVTAMAGVDHNIPVEGENLTSENWHERIDAVLIETYGSYGDSTPEKRARTVANGQYRYTRYGNGFEMLYDVENDPDETNNLAGVHEYQAKIHELRKTMLDLIAAQYIPLPGRNKHPFGSH